jgi:chromodomain-helicase-DNA-binding protein 4
VLFHVLLTSYEVLSAEAAELGRLEWGALVVDEGHRLKNKEARLFKDLQGLRCHHRVLLTGAPPPADCSGAGESAWGAAAQRALL